MLSRLILIGTLFLAFSSAQAAPFSVSFNDTNNYWTNWESGSSSIDARDVIFNPDISGGTATITSGGYLTSVSFSYTSNDPLGIPVGDLFIDVGADQRWDYVLTTSGMIDPSGTNFSTPFATPSFTHPTYTEKYAEALYHFNGGFSALRGDGYDDYYVQTPPTGNLRNNHAFALSDFGATQGTIVDTSVYFDDVFEDWIHDPNGADNIINFAMFGIDLAGQDFIIGFGPDCANDVIYEEVNNPVPLPGSLLLFGSGILGFFGVRRRKK